MKKIVLKNIALVMAAVLIMTVGFAGCGKKESTTTAAAGSAKSGTSAAADDSWSKVQKKGELVLGLDDGFPPMGFRDQNNNIVGFDIDVAKEVCKRLNVKLKLQPINWDAKDMELNSGNIDCIWNGFTMNGLESKYLFSSPYMNNRQVMVVKKGSKLATEKDFAGKKVAVQKDSSAAKALDQHADFKKTLKDVVTFPKYDTALRDLDIGQVDGVLVDEIVANYKAKQGANIKVLDFSLASEQYGVGFKLGAKSLHDKVEETLQTMAKDGTFAKISNNWFGKDIVTLGK